MIFRSFDSLTFYLNMSAFNQALHLFLLLLLSVPFYHIIHSIHKRSRYLIDLILTRHPLILPQDPLLHTLFQMMMMMMMMILRKLINLFLSRFNCYFCLLLLSISHFYLLLLLIFPFSP